MQGDAALLALHGGRIQYDDDIAQHTLIVFTDTNRYCSFSTKGSRPSLFSSSHMYRCSLRWRAHMASKPSAEAIASASRMPYQFEIMPVW